MAARCDIIFIMNKVISAFRSGLKAGTLRLLQNDGIKYAAKRLLGRSAPVVRNWLLGRSSPLAANFVSPQLNDHKTLSSLADVDSFLDGIRPDFTERELRDYWDKHHLDRNVLFGQSADTNPFSSEYRAHVVHEYSTLSGRPLNSYENELTPSIDRQIHIARPFPYDMKRASVSVSNMLYTFARLFSLVQVEEGQRLVEFGSGWGNAAFQFAQAGVSVTLVDIDANFLGLAKDRFARLGMGIECKHGEFNDVGLAENHYDYALFVSAFHHCIDHVELLKKIHRSLKHQGKILFCDEPINEAFEVPWGIRMDGESLWAIRRLGWLELGFQENYFRECLHAAGFVLEKHVFSAERAAIIWIARKI